MQGFAQYYETGPKPWYIHTLPDGVQVAEAQPGNYYVLSGVGENGDVVPTEPVTTPPEASKWAMAYGALSTASMAVSAYHGYKRNQSVGWALAWAAAGALFPVITPTIAVAQGFGKRKAGR